MVCAWVYLKKDVRSCVLLAFVVDCVCVSYVCLRCFGWPCLVLCLVMFVGVFLLCVRRVVLVVIYVCYVCVVLFLCVLDVVWFVLFCVRVSYCSCWLLVCV